MSKSVKTITVKFYVNIETDDEKEELIKDLNKSDVDIDEFIQCIFDTCENEIIDVEYE